MRRWIVFTLIVPLAAWGLYKLADELEARRGESRATQLMRLPHRYRKRLA